MTVAVVLYRGLDDLVASLAASLLGLLVVGLLVWAVATVTSAFLCAVARALRRRGVMVGLVLVGVLAAIAATPSRASAQSLTVDGGEWGHWGQFNAGTTLRINDLRIDVVVDSAKRITISETLPPETLVCWKGDCKRLAEVWPPTTGWLNPVLTTNELNADSLGSPEQLSVSTLSPAVRVSQRPDKEKPQVQVPCPCSGVEKYSAWWWAAFCFMVPAPC